MEYIGTRDGKLGNVLGDLYHCVHSCLWYRYEQSKRQYASTSVYVIRGTILLSGLLSCVDSQYVRTSNRQYWGAETDEHSVDYQSIA
jgi:hypothetical protein